MAGFRFHHGAISVPDLEQAIAWYGDMLGYTLEKRFSVPPASSRAAMLRKGEMRVEVFEIAGASALPPERRSVPGDLSVHGNKHVAYRVDDFERALADFEARGVEIAFVVREAFGKGFFIRDCAGNLIEFVEELAD